MQRREKQIVLGAEYDGKLRDSLLQVLDAMGGKILNEWSGVAGSQELQRLEVALGGETVVAESETYIGLTISGAAELVDSIAAHVNARMAAA